METPLIVALARQVSVRDQMDAIANNIANMSTGAFKGERVMFKDYLARTENGDAVVFPQQAGIHRNTAPGPITRTSNPLDVAIRGEGYFEVETPSGLRYTRNGHFALDADGRLVTGAGHPVMDTNDQPFVFDTDIRNITIAADGTVSADEDQVGRIKIVTFEDHQRLERRGAGLYAANAPLQPAEDIELLQGHIEGSNVQPILEITAFMRATGHYQHAKKLVDDEHDRLRRAIQVLGSAPE